MPETFSSDRPSWRALSCFKGRTLALFAIPGAFATNFGEVWIVGPIFAPKTRTEVESISRGSTCVPPEVFRSEDPTLGTTTVVPESNS